MEDERSILAFNGELWLSRVTFWLAMAGSWLSRVTFWLAMVGSWLFRAIVGGDKEMGIVSLMRHIAKHKKNASGKKNVGEGVLVAGNCLECVLGAGAHWVLMARVLVPDGTGVSS